LAGIYIHIPFCRRKCHYCDFYSVTDASLTKNFAIGIFEETGLASREFPGFPSADSIFIGGGTPSILPAGEIADIISGIDNEFGIKSGAEITIETNPESLSQEKLRIYKLAGVNRISLGVQSFDDSELRFLQRAHDSQAARQAVENIISEGFENFNIDLIFGVPGQTPESWRRTIEIALEYAPSHISAYGLIFEPGTPLFEDLRQNRISEYDTDKEADLYKHLISKLLADGFEHYEISNFARPGFRSRHNLNYWNGGDYLALGPAAHGFVGGIRYANYKDIVRYLAVINKGLLPIAWNESPGKNESIEEFVMLNLRQGRLSLDELSKKFDLKIGNGLLNIINALKNDKKINFIKHKIHLTPEGLLISDEIAVWILRELI
jgi:oxygen-independent coproporphyrinogen-3 oxidase